MFWKSLVCLGLVCVLAAPALAAPTLNVAANSALDSNGNWVWAVGVAPDAALFVNNPPNGVGGSVATELGLTASSANLVSAVKDAANFPNDNTGNSPFAAPINGVQIGVVTSGNNAFAALGSTYFTDGANKSALVVTTLGPSTGNDINNAATRTTTLGWSGAYTGNARIAQAGQNFDTYVGSASKTVIAADADLNGTVGLSDFNTVINNLGVVGFWNKGNFNNPNGGAVGTDTTVGLSDFNLVVNRLGFTTGSGAGAVVAGVPEPSAVALAVLAMLSAVGLIRRK
jgi:hypothetical protein